MRNSLKQLLHTPVKAALFFLLMAAASLLLIFGSVMLVQSLQRIDAAEEQFTTIGFVEQKPTETWQETITWNKCWGEYTQTVNEYDQILSSDSLYFDGANYIYTPEVRPYYQAYVSGINHTEDRVYSTYIMEFTALADCCLSEPSDVRVDRILLNKEAANDTRIRPMLGLKANLEEGDIIQISDFSKENAEILKAGKKYIANIVWAARNQAGYYMAYPAPFSSQYGAEDGCHLLPLKVREGKESIPIPWRLFEYTLSNPPCSRVEEVTDGFYDEGARGQDWMTWIELHKEYGKTSFVLPTNGLQLLPTFHDKQMSIAKGREITAEEFENGAAVCMISDNFATKNLLDVGDKITLSLVYALYGYIPDYDNTFSVTKTGRCYPTYFKGYSPLDADMKPYEPFWEAEYEIVGTYEPLSPNTLLCGTTEIARDMFIIPMKSVQASDENNIAHYGPMNALNTSFQIPNGTIQEFDAALREAVPEVSQLNITYDDNGYEEVMGSLRSARLTAILLFLVGLVSTVAIVILLLFFFIVKQKKRTAIERSLGMSKKQCRISLIAGILVLTIVAAMVGSLGGALLLNSMDRNADITETTEFDTSYSLWAQNRPMEVELDESDAAMTAALYIAIPILLMLFVFLLSLVLVNQNLKVEPVLLLSTKGE